MSGLLDDLQEMEPAAGRSSAVTMREMKGKVDTGRNGADGDLRIMDHFVRGLIEHPDET